MDAPSKKKHQGKIEPINYDVKIQIKSTVEKYWEERKNKSLTQADLANALGVAPETVSRLLHRRDGYWWTESRLVKFANFIEINVRSLIPESEWSIYPSAELNTPPRDFQLKIYEGYVEKYIYDYMEFKRRVQNQVVKNIALRLILLLDKQVHEIEEAKLQKAIGKCTLSELISQCT